MIEFMCILNSIEKLTIYSNIAVNWFKNNKYSANEVLKKLKMTVSRIIMEIYNDSITMVLE